MYSQATRKAPEVATPGLFYSIFCEAAWTSGSLPVVTFYRAICICSMPLHLPQQKVRMNTMYSQATPPFFAGIGDGSIISIT